MIELHKLYNVHEIAGTLDVHPKTIYQRCREGKLPPLAGIGRRRGYIGEVLLDLLRNGYQPKQ